MERGSRRAALRRLAACVFAASGAWLSVARAAEQQALVCAKPRALSEAQRRQRELDNYTEESPDPRKTCSGCRFFTPGAGAQACGMCALFNGPANPRGRCDDWTARPA